MGISAEALRRCRTCVQAMAFVSLLSGCNTTTRMDLPKVAVSAPATAPGEIRDQPTIALGGVVSAIPRGTTVIHFPVGGPLIDGTLCNDMLHGRSTIEWTSGSQYFGNWQSEIGEVFFDTFSARKVNVVGDPRAIFERESKVQSAEYLLGARISEMKGNFCELHDWLTGKRRGLFRGEMFLRVEWEIYSTLARRTVATVETEGYYVEKEASRSGITLGLMGAFASAAENLLGEEAFRSLLERRSVTPVSVAAAMREGGKGATPVSIPAARNFSAPLSEVQREVVAAVVTIRAGGGHGSGFVIGEDGYVLTNAHVVGEGERVQVVFSNGVEATGGVLRKDVRRDVALVQVPLRTRSLLPVRDEPVRPVEDVYAVGSPLLESLSATITKGIVSSVRSSSADEPSYIQADVPISPGNSGGPLVDGNGNVVGVAVATLVAPKAQNLNLFIPITEALAVLDIRMEVDRRRPGS